MKLETIHKISGKIRLLSGLHIGASKENIEIGGLDNPIIKDPLPGSHAPYIPGSSLKGKIRCLLELRHEKISEKGKPCGCGQCDICAVFGSSSPDNRPEALGPPRIVVRDANLSEEWQSRFERGELPMEVKYENSINRISGTAQNPRPLERVPAGVEFDFSISLKKFKGDEDYLPLIYQGMKMLQYDALGGCGSRGCGQIEFVDVEVDGEKKDDNFLDEIEL